MTCAVDWTGPRRGVPCGVVHDVRERLSEDGGVAHGGDGVGAVHDRLHAIVERRLRDDLGEHRLQGDERDQQPAARALDPREAEQRVDHAYHSIALPRDVADEALALCRIVLRARFECGRCDRDRRDRCAQLVCGVLDELGVGQLAPLALEEVVEDDRDRGHRALVVAQRGGTRRQRHHPPVRNEDASDGGPAVPPLERRGDLPGIGVAVRRHDAVRQLAVPGLQDLACTAVLAGRQPRPGVDDHDPGRNLLVDGLHHAELPRDARIELPVQLPNGLLGASLDADVDDRPPDLVLERRRRARARRKGRPCGARDARGSHPTRPAAAGLASRSGIPDGRRGRRS